MAEAAALALGAQILRELRVHQPFFLLDNQQLVSFFNGTDHANPPHWDIKPLTQTSINITSAIGGKIFKIDRKLNLTTHVLGQQAYHSAGRTFDGVQATSTKFSSCKQLSIADGFKLCTG